MKSEIHFDRPNFVHSEEKAYTRTSDPYIIDFTNAGSYIHARLPRLNTFLPSHVVSEFPTVSIPRIYSLNSKPIRDLGNVLGWGCGAICYAYTSSLRPTFFFKVYFLSLALILSHSLPCFLSDSQLLCVRCTNSRAGA